jgi:hypothetical protein
MTTKEGRRSFVSFFAATRLPDGVVQSVLIMPRDKNSVVVLAAVS